MSESVVMNISKSVYHRFYGADIPDSVAQLLDEALSEQILDLTESEILFLDKVYKKKADLISLELALKAREPMNPLSRLFRLISYIVEISGHEQNKYIKPPGFLSTWLACIGLVVMSVLRRFKGYFMLMSDKYV